MSERGRRRRAGLAWFAVATALAVGAHLLGVAVSTSAGRAMRGTSTLATEAALAYAPLNEAFRLLSFAFVTGFSIVYMLPVWCFFASGRNEEASPVVQRRVLGAPLLLSLVSLTPWVASVLLAVGFTLTHFGTWASDLSSEQVISPLMAGFVAATAQYLMFEWMFREQLVPRVFGEGRLSEVHGARTLTVAARLVVLAFALGFAPAFSLLGLVAAAEERMKAAPDPALVTELLRTTFGFFAFFMLTGIGYVTMFARSLTVPLAQMARAVGDIRRGTLEVQVPVRTRDELGALAEGVNSLAASLREREHILRTFGRIVDPGVRDRLLAGGASPRGERREVAVLFADVRAFTLYAERRAPEEVVVTLNALFGILTAEVGRFGGSVDKFLGDGLLAVFGLFDDDPDAAAAAALGCALAMRSAVERYAATRVGEGDEAVRVAIALHAGPVVAATLGAENRFDYTIVGDVVNVTSRLLDVGKERGRELVVSAAALTRAQRAGALAEADWSGEVGLRGREAGVEACTLREADSGPA